MTEPRKPFSYGALTAFIFSAIGFVPLSLPLAIRARRKINDAELPMVGMGLVWVSFLINAMWTAAFLYQIPAILAPGIGLMSKTTEAKVVLGGIKWSQESFYAEYDNYAPLRKTPSAALSTVKVPWDAVACPTNCRREDPSPCTEFSCLGYEPAGQVYYRYACVTQPARPGVLAEFSCGAVADLDGDGDKGSFTYRSGNNGATTSTLADGLSACGDNAIPAGEVYDCNPGEL